MSSESDNRTQTRFHEIDMRAVMETYGVDRARAEIMLERQRVYGEPEANHQGIAQSWVPLLQPWCLRIAAMQPIPAHVVSGLMAMLKACRRRIEFHEDSFDDESNYHAFSRVFHRRFARKGGDGYTPPVTLTARPDSQARLVLCWEYEDEDGEKHLVRASTLVEADGQQTLLPGESQDPVL